MKFVGFRTVHEHPREWDWIRLKFYLDSIEKIVQSIRNVNYDNFGFMIFNVEFIAVNVGCIGDVCLRKIIRDDKPDSGIWIRYFISINKKSSLYPEGQDVNFFQKIGIKDHRIISINLGDDPNKLLQELYNINISIDQYNKKVDQVLKEAKWNQGKGKSPYHDWVERNVPGMDTLPQDWKTTPGMILMKCNGDLYFLPLRKLFDTIWNEYYILEKESEYISMVGRHIINKIIQSLHVYNDVMIKGLNYSNIVSFNDNIDWNPSLHQDMKEIFFDKENFLQLVDQDLLTEIVYDFIEEYLNPEKIPDWRLRDEFFKNIYNYMMARNHPFQNKDYHEAILDYDIWNSKDNVFKRKFYNDILDNFYEFLETRLKEQPVLENKGIRQAIIQDLLYREEKGDEKEKNREILSEKYTIWDYYGDTNPGLCFLIDGKPREFRTGMSGRKLYTLLNIIMKYWSNKWKRKELIGEEFFLINQLRGESGEEINNRGEFDLVVIENNKIFSNNKMPFYLIKMIDQKDNRMYSVCIDEPHKGIHQASKNIRGDRINKYKFAAMATPGTRVLLKAQVKRIYQDTVYFVPNNRLNRVHSIRLLNPEKSGGNENMGSIPY
jgi:hypothetical protein